MVADILSMPVKDVAVLTTEELANVSLKDITRFFRKNRKNANIGVIYSYTSLVFGKKYIGQTIDPYGRNYAHHCCCAPSSQRAEKNSVFSQALRAEGFDNFAYNVLTLCHCPDREQLRKELDRQEEKYIALFDTTDPGKGYNVYPGGFSTLLDGYSVWAKAVKQYSLSGEYIARYDSASGAGRAVGIRGSDIVSACSPNYSRKSAGGFLWTYDEDELPPGLVEYLRDLSLRGVIHRYTIDGEYIDSFQTLADAAKVVNGDIARISYCGLPPNIHVSYGYRWSKERKDRLETEAVSLAVEVHQYDQKGCYTASYTNMANAAKAIKSKSPTHIGHCIKDHWRKAGGYYWRTTRTDCIAIPENPNLKNRLTRLPVHRYSLDGDYIDSFVNCLNATEIVGGEPSAIVSVCAPPYDKIAYGYRWSREKMAKLAAPLALVRVPVYKYDRDGHYVDSYECMADGAASVGSSNSTSHLKICMRDHWRTSGGYYWRTFKLDRIEIPTIGRRRDGK